MTEHPILAELQELADELDSAHKQTEDREDGNCKIIYAGEIGIIADDIRKIIAKHTEGESTMTMITPEIEKRLIEWGGVRGTMELDLVQFATRVGHFLYFCFDGEVSFREHKLAPWKTLDDIIRVLDVFGVVRKASPKWTICPAEGMRSDWYCYHEDKLMATLASREAADEYAAWKNAQEGG